MAASAWLTTVVPGSGSLYRHYFLDGSNRSACGRTTRESLATDLADPDLARTCQVCRRKREAELRLEQPLPEVVPVNADNKLNIIEATDLICSFLGPEFITPNAMYNRVWRVLHKGADPACAPRFGHIGKKAFFQREAVMEWIRLQVKESQGMDFSHLPPDLARLL